LVENRPQVCVDQDGRELADSLRIAPWPYNEENVTKERSKAVKRHQLKERWFDAGTAAFERVFPGARAKRFPETENPYICPLCAQPYPRTAIADGTLTFEDAPPKSYGGKPVALSCKPCNNALGSSLDAPLSTLDGNEMSPCRLAIDGVEVIAYQEIRPDGRFFAIPENQNNPSHRAQFFKGLERVTHQPPGQLTYKRDMMKRRRADLAWLKAAYIVAFARWGYSYAFSPALRVVREQLRQPGEEIIRQFKLENRKSPRDTRFIIYIREPRELEGVAVGVGHHIVLLPANARDMTIYDRLEAALKSNPSLSLTGDTYNWPTSPTYSIDFVPFDSVLVLPTPGEVRMLS
jgi:hypothetical protein